MRSPTLDEIEAVFLANYDPSDRDNPDRLRNALAVVRDAILMGPSRAHLRAKAGQRARVRSPARSRKHNDPDFVTRTLREIVQSRDREAADRDVLERVARFTRVPVATLLAQDRSQSAARARFVAMWVLRNGRKRSWPEVAAVLQRTNSAVINGARRVDAEVAADPALGELLRGLAA